MPDQNLSHPCFLPLPDVFQRANIHSLPVDGKRDIFKVVSGKMYINLYPSGHLVIHAPGGAGGLRPIRYTQGHTVMHAPDGADGLRPIRYRRRDMG